MADELPPLTDAQKDYIEDNWKLPLKELCQAVFSDPSVTLHDPRCKLVKAHLASLGRESPKKDVRVEPYVLTESDILYIQNNHTKAGWYELAQTLFGKGIPNGERRCRAVMNYCREIDPAFNKSEELADDEEYQPPKNISQLLGMVNQYAIAPRQEGKKLLDPSKLTNAEKRQLQMLLSYMNLPLFRASADRYIRRLDRELFETTIIVFCWDKDDLMGENVHQYIELASITVEIQQISRTVQKLDQRVNSWLDNPDDKNLKMTEIELLNSVREKANALRKQHEALLKSLVGQRADREGARQSQNATLHQLVTSFMEKEKRERFLAEAAKYRTKLGDEVKRLSEMDALRAEIFGLDPDDILN